MSEIIILAASHDIAVISRKIASGKYVDIYRDVLNSRNNELTERKSEKRN